MKAQLISMWPDKAEGAQTALVRTGSEGVFWSSEMEAAVATAKKGCKGKAGTTSQNFLQSSVLSNFLCRFSKSVQFCY